MIYGGGARDEEKRGVEEWREEGTQQWQYRFNSLYSKQLAGWAVTFDLASFLHWYKLHGIFSVSIKSNVIKCGLKQSAGCRRSLAGKSCILRCAGVPGIGQGRDLSPGGSHLISERDVMAAAGEPHLREEDSGQRSIFISDSQSGQRTLAASFKWPWQETSVSSLRWRVLKVSFHRRILKYQVLFFCPADKLCLCVFIKVSHWAFVAIEWKKSCLWKLRLQPYFPKACYWYAKGCR